MEKQERIAQRKSEEELRKKQEVAQKAKIQLELKAKAVEEAELQRACRYMTFHGLLYCLLDRVFFDLVILDRMMPTGDTCGYVEIYVESAVCQSASA